MLKRARSGGRGREGERTRRRKVEGHDGSWRRRSVKGQLFGVTEVKR